jgi:predicted  nucleic acid-binding Zn-ribbon protein
MKQTNFEEKVLSALNNLQVEVGSMKEGQQELRGDVKSLQEGQESLKSNFKTLQLGQEDLKKSVRRLEVLQEQTEEKIDQIIEAVKPEMEQTTQNTLDIAGLKSKTSFMDKRLKVLEQA